jgi:signal transduction histidine kinase
MTETRPVTALTEFVARVRAERLVALGRVVLAAASLLAIWLDPADPTRIASRGVYLTLFVYLVHSLAMSLWASHADALPRRFGLATHVIDLVFVSVLHMFTAASSLFFPYLLFILVAAAMRWPRRGALWSVPLVIGVFLVIGVVIRVMFKDPAFDSYGFVVRSSYLAVVGVLITYVTTHQETLREELSRLAGWPEPSGDTAHARLAPLLDYAAETLRSPRVVLAWEESDEPWLHLVSRTAFGCDWCREPAGAYTPLVPDALESAAFFCPNAAADPPVVLYEHGGELHRYAVPPLHPAIQARFGVGAIVSVPIRGTTFSGRLLVLDKSRLSRDDIVLATAVAHYLSAGLEHMYFAEQLQNAATMQERARLAQDLHDGFLQSLTAIDLRLEALATNRDVSPGVRAEIVDIQGIVTAEYADLRGFVRSLPWRGDDVGPPFDLGQQLAELPARLERHWSVRVKLTIEAPPAAGLPAERARSLYFLAREAAVNAARHAGATEITMSLSADGGHLRLVITDNGRGLGFEGRYDQEELAALGLGPRSLRTRAEKLGGEMVIDTDSTGTRLEFALPVVAA